MQLQNLLNNIAKLSHAQQLLKVIFWILWNTQWYIFICRYIYVAGNVVDEKKKCINYRVRRKRGKILVLFNLQQQDYRNLAVHWIFIIFYYREFSQICTLIHPVQIPWCDAPRWLPRSINLLKLTSRSQIMPPRPINE